MIYRYFYYLLFVFIISCEHHESKIIFKQEKKEVPKVQELKKDEVVKKTSNDNSTKLKVLNNKGFALIYDEKLVKDKIISKKISNDTIIIYNKDLADNTPVKVTNLINGKFLISKTSNKLNYPFFYNSVVSKRLANEISLIIDEPYVQIETLNSKNIYVANEAKTFDEEKNVANKAPIDTITIQNIGLSDKKKIKKIKKKNKKFSYIIKFADLYFEHSAIMLRERLMNEFNIKNISIKKLSKDSYRVFKGPFNDLGSLKKEYMDMNNIDFENIEIIKL